MIKLETGDFVIEIDEEKLIDKCKMFKLARSGKFQKTAKHNFDLFPKECLEYLHAFINEKSTLNIQIE